MYSVLFGQPTGLNMATSIRLRSSVHLRWLRRAPGFLALAVLAGCSSPRQSSQSAPEACARLSQTLVDEKMAFVARVKAIRDQHLLVRDYDRQMIAALNQRRAALESTSLTELSVSEEIFGCSGEQLGDLRREAHEEMTSLQSFLSTFNRALREDTSEVYIDRR